MIGVIGIFGALSMRVLQIVRTLKTKTVAGMSRTSWLLLCANVGAWGGYGLLIDNWLLVVTLGLALGAAVVVLGVSQHFRAPSASQAEINSNE